MTTENSSVDELVPLLEPHDGQNKRNHTRSVVCELKFPTLLSLAGPQPPKAFVSALRRAYPILELGNEVSIGPAQATSSGHSHILRTSKRTWSVTLKKDSVSIETSKYTFYKEFRAKVEEIVAAVSPVVDSDFFTRVGLRYVNLVKTDGNSKLSEWINPILVGVTDQQFRNVSELAGRIRLQTDEGGCFLQHGIKHKESSDGEIEATDVVPDYVVDIDCYREDVVVNDIMEKLDRMRLQAYSLFDWTLGDRAREFMKD